MQLLEPLGNVFIVRRLFASTKFPYEPVNTNIFPIDGETIKHLSRLGLVVGTTACDGASDVTTIACFKLYSSFLILPVSLQLLFEGKAVGVPNTSRLHI